MLTLFTALFRVLPDCESLYSFYGSSNTHLSSSTTGWGLTEPRNIEIMAVEAWKMLHLMVHLTKVSIRLPTLQNLQSSSSRGATGAVWWKTLSQKVTCPSPFEIGEEMLYLTFWAVFEYVFQLLWNSHRVQFKRKVPNISISQLPPKKAKLPPKYKVGLPPNTKLCRNTVRMRGRPRLRSPSGFQGDTRVAPRALNLSGAGVCQNQRRFNTSELREFPRAFARAHGIKFRTVSFQSFMEWSCVWGRFLSCGSAEMHTWGFGWFSVVLFCWRLRFGCLFVAYFSIFEIQ